MEFPIKFDTVKSELYIIYIEGSHLVVIFFLNIVFLSLKINFAIANSADPDEMLHYV